MNKKEKELLKAIGQNIVKTREAQNIGPQELSIKSDVGRTQIYMIENGKTNPRIITLLKIADGLQVRLEDLFES